LEASDPRVRVIEMDHCNIPTKFARVVTEAKGEWVAFLDADDIACWPFPSRRWSTDFTTGTPRGRISTR
jgi:hypothetical protein